MAGLWVPNYKHMFVKPLIWSKQVNNNNHLNLIYSRGLVQMEASSSSLKVAWPRGVPRVTNHNREHPHTFTLPICWYLNRPLERNIYLWSMFHKGNVHPIRATISSCKLANHEAQGWFQRRSGPLWMCKGGLDEEHSCVRFGPLAMARSLLLSAWRSAWRSEWRWALHPHSVKTMGRALVCCWICQSEKGRDQFQLFGGTPPTSIFEAREGCLRHRTITLKE